MTHFEPEVVARISEYMDKNQKDSLEAIAKKSLRVPVVDEVYISNFDDSHLELTCNIGDSQVVATVPWKFKVTQQYQLREALLLLLEDALDV
jgi:hypothetical protein